jgi:YidC/Oxa1 family membrane protein insertase
VLIVQMPILLGLYRAIIATLAATPTQLLNLSGRLWVTGLSAQVPLQNKFLWLNLAVPDPLYVLPVLVVVTTWLQQKLLMPASSAPSGSDKGSDQASQVSRQMMMLMPLMFGFFALTFASGLSIYFIVSNIIGIGQYAAMGRIKLPWKHDETASATPPKKKAPSASAPATTTASETATAAPAVTSTSSAVSSARSGRKKSVSMPRKAKRSDIYDSRAERAKAKSKPKG